MHPFLATGFFTSLVNWFAGGDHPYMRLYGCMGRDKLWVGITVGLDLLNAAGYALIALHWWRNARTLPDIPAKRALWNLRNIFVFCGVCGYLFIPIKMVWPAWRLYDIFLAVLCFYTWRYAWGARDLKVVYRQLGKTSELEKDLQKSREEARQRSFFLNAISHDLRTPLNGLVLQANLAELSAANKDDETLKSTLLDLRASAAAAASLLDSLLECARLDFDVDQNRISTFDLSVMLNELIARHQAAALATGLELTLECPAGLSISTDGSKLERVIGNLLSNALKFTGQGSVRVLVERARGGVEIHVIDTGPGVAPDVQERLFDEFFQVHNHERDRAKGFGLGLSIAKRLARQLGGDVVVDSAPGQGSRFSVLLPDTAAGRPVEQAPASRVSASVGA